MSERKIEILHDETRYLVHSLSEQSIRDGMVRTVSVPNGIDYVFAVARENRQLLGSVMKEIEEYFANPHLAITDERKMRWMGTIETALIPPVEVIGPLELLW